MRSFVAVILIGLSACSAPNTMTPRSIQTSSTVADVKTCGCPSSIKCQDCCGPKDCKCQPN